MVVKDDVFMGPAIIITHDLYPSPLHVKPPTQICDGAVIGAGAVLPVCMGYGAFVAVGAAVTCDVPDHVVASGSPAKMVGGTKDVGFAKKQKIRDAGTDPRAWP